MEDVEQALEEYGLSKNERKVYLTCLRIGTSSVYKIAEKTALPKSTCYDTLHALQEKGFVGSMIEGKKKHFQAANPEKLIQVIEEKRERLKEVIPRLKELEKTEHEIPRVHVFSGKEGIKTIFDKVLETKKDFLIIGNFEKFKGVLPFYSEAFVKKRVKNGIKCKLIEEMSRKNIILKKKDKNELRTTKFLKCLKKESAEILIFEGKIALVTLTENEPTAILIENKEIFNLFQVLFKELWANTSSQK